MLVFFRVMQGVGGGGLQPSEQAILADTFPPEKLGMAFAIYGMAVVLAPAIGPTLGGYITDNFNWRWIFFINVPVGIISLLLTYRMVEDPPYLKKEERKAGWRANIDFHRARADRGRPRMPAGGARRGPGARLVRLAHDHLVHRHLDASRSSRSSSGSCARRIRSSICRLFRERTFATAILMMFMLGFGLFGSTILLPHYLQQLMGYTAQQAGMVLSPGGFVIVADDADGRARWCRKVEARWLIAIGFPHHRGRVPGMTQDQSEHRFPDRDDLPDSAVDRTRVPVRADHHHRVSGHPAEQEQPGVGIINLARNIGGSIGIAMVTTLVARRSQFHQDRIASHVTRYDHVFRNGLNALTSDMMQQGYSSVDASHQAYGRIYGLMQQQAAALAFVDVIWVFAVAALFMVPLVLLMKKNDPGKVSMAH